MSTAGGMTVPLFGVQPQQQQQQQQQSGFSFTSPPAQIQQPSPFGTTTTANPAGAIPPFKFGPAGTAFASTGTTTTHFGGTGSNISGVSNIASSAQNSSTKETANSTARLQALSNFEYSSVPAKTQLSRPVGSEFVTTTTGTTMKGFTSHSASTLELVLTKLVSQMDRVSNILDGVERRLTRIESQQLQSTSSTPGDR